MPIRYRCDSCSQLLSIATKMAGQSIPCPRCGTANVIPQPGTPLEQRPVATSQSPTSPVGTTPPSTSSPSPLSSTSSTTPAGVRPVLPPLPLVPRAAGSKPPLSPIPTSATPSTLPPTVSSPARQIAAVDDAEVFVEKRDPGVGGVVADPRFEETVIAQADDRSGALPADDTILQPASDEKPGRSERKPEGKSRRSKRKRESTEQEPATADGDPPLAAAFAITRRGRNSEDEEMDLTPMVDMTFLLLIFFMITASFSMQKSINFPPPGAEKKGASQQLQSLDDLEEKAIIVRIDDQNAILVEDEPVGDATQLASRFRNLMRSSGQNEVVVTAADAAFHETVVKVIDAANDAGVERIRLGASADE